MSQITVNSPAGPLAIAEDQGHIVSLDWGWPMAVTETPLLCEARDQIEAYFAGTRRVFELPLKPFGTPFQRRVWAVLAAIPYGTTRTYGDIAAELGTSARAVGGACGRNPIPILIPCHRVIGLHGHLGGYSGGDGIETKTFLLTLEGCSP